MVHLGVISSERPTVSHLLINHPEYSADCWEIIHSDLNKNKPYTRIPAGTHIYIDPESHEIVWDCASPNQLAARTKECFHDDSFIPSSSQEFSSSLHKEYRSNHPLKQAAADFIMINHESSSEQQLINMYISRAAARYNLPEALIRGVIKAESDFQVHAVSPAGAQGLMQLMPTTAEELGVKDTFNMEENINGGAKYLKKMLNIFNGDLEKALAAYNAGPQTVQKYQGSVPFTETRHYVQKVLSFINHYQ
ncbi:MAG: lytic transglycosylase domain-containing protein [Desulfobacterales bacterium]